MSALINRTENSSTCSIMVSAWLTRYACATDSGTATSSPKPVAFSAIAIPWASDAERSAAENQEPHVRQHRVRLRAELDGVLDLAGPHELDDPLDEGAPVDLRPENDGVQSLEEHGESDHRNDEDEVHDPAAASVVLQQVVQHLRASSEGSSSFSRHCLYRKSAGAVPGPCSDVT